MLTKALVILGLIVVATQAASIERTRNENPIASALTNDVNMNDISASDLLEIFELFKQNNFETDQLINKEEKIKFIISLVLKIMKVDNIEEILCVVNVAMETDREETWKNLNTIIEQGPDFIRLHIQRRQQLEECEAIGGESPSAAELIQRRRCIAQVEVYLGTQITIVTLRVRSAVNYFRSIASNLDTCASHLLPGRPQIV